MALLTPTRLAQTQPGTTYATAYTVPASTTCIIKEVIVCNVTGAAAVLDVSFVASGGTAGTANNVIAQHQIGAYSMVIYSFSSVMATGGFISMKAGTAAALTVTISGVQYS